MKKNFKFILTCLILLGCCPEGTLKKGVEDQIEAMFGPLKDWDDDIRVEHKKLRDSNGIIYRTTSKVLKDSNPYGHPQALEEEWPANPTFDESELEAAIKLEVPHLYKEIFGDTGRCDQDQAPAFLAKLLGEYPKVADVGMQLLMDSSFDTSKVQLKFEEHDDCAVENRFKGVTFNPAKELKRLIKKQNPKAQEEAIEKLTSDSLEGLCQDTAKMGYRFCIATAVDLPNFQSYCHSGSMEKNQVNYLKLHNSCKLAHHVLYWRCKNARCFAVPQSLLDGIKF